VISAVSLTRQFGARVAVDHVTFTVNASEIVALLGPNGAGKTTTLRMLAGLIAPTSGRVTIDNVELTRRTAGQFRSRIGFLTETPGLWERLTLRENLEVYARLYGLEPPSRAVDEMLDTLALSDRAAARAAELSKGMRQKAALARALLHRPSILLLDEPTSGLDPEITRTVRSLLEERRSIGCAILISTHNLDEAERLADRVAVLDGRLLALDHPEALRQRLTTGRLIVRIGNPAAPIEAAARAFDPDLILEGSRMILTMPRADRDTPTLLRALVQAGADVLEVRPEIPALEDVYLHLLGADSPIRKGDL
jgi:ABC-2 type transport system ATP-binding protein